ncbi:MAG: hypothetical protein N2115_03865 [bacterium]|nr:hypothetical protein [bacterium]
MVSCAPPYVPVPLI